MVIYDTTSIKHLVEHGLLRHYCYAKLKHLGIHTLKDIRDQKHLDMLYKEKLIGIRCYRVLNCRFYHKKKAYADDFVSPEMAEILQRAFQRQTYDEHDAAVNLFYSYFPNFLYLHHLVQTDITVLLSEISCTDPQLHLEVRKVLLSYLQKVLFECERRHLYGPDYVHYLSMEKALCACWNYFRFEEIYRLFMNKSTAKELYNQYIFMRRGIILYSDRSYVETLFPTLPSLLPYLGLPLSAYEKLAADHHYSPKKSNKLFKFSKEAIILFRSFCPSTSLVYLTKVYSNLYPFLSPKEISFVIHFENTNGHLPYFHMLEQDFLCHHIDISRADHLSYDEKRDLSIDKKYSVLRGAYNYASMASEVSYGEIFKVARKKRKTSLHPFRAIYQNEELLCSFADFMKLAAHVPLEYLGHKVSPLSQVLEIKIRNNRKKYHTAFSQDRKRDQHF